jgi:hypothetical protein
MKYFIFKVAETKDLIGGGPRRKALPAIFVAYRFDSDKSSKFRADFGSAIRRTSSLTDVEILDGRVDIGDNWPKEVRIRLTRAQLVIADLSSLSKEVLFECGFAWGLGQKILPVTASITQRSNVPAWLTDMQWGHYMDDGGLDNLIDSVAQHLRSRNKTRIPPRSAAAKPPSVFVISNNNEQNGIHDLVQSACREWELENPGILTDVDSLDALEDDRVEEASRASLLVGELNGGRADSFVHFASGAILAKPTSGISSKRFTKRVLLVVPKSYQRDMVASGARKIKHVRVITKEDLVHELREHGKSYRNWSIIQEQEG